MTHRRALILFFIIIGTLLTAYGQFQNDDKISDTSNDEPVVTLEARDVTETSAELRGELLDLEGNEEVEVFFKVREVGVDFEETWWVGADPHVGREDLNALEHLETAVADVNELGITQKAIILGDLVQDDAQYVEPFKNAMNELDHEWTYVLGNHDYDREGDGGRIMERNFFSKDIGGVRFIALSDDGRWQGGHADEGGYVVARYQTEKNLMHDQNDWFKSLLEDDPDRPTILWTHQGLSRMYDNPGDDGPDVWDPVRRGWLQENIHDYNIKMWIHGHHHRMAFRENYRGHGFVDVRVDALRDGDSAFMHVKAEGSTTKISIRHRDHLNEEWLVVDGHEEFVMEIETGLETTTPWEATDSQMMTEAGEFSYELEGLNPEKTYDFKAVAKIDGEEVSGQVLGFSTDIPILISDWHDLHKVREDLEADYILKNDLDEQTSGYDTYNSGEGWEPIGEYSDRPFTGSFNGKGKLISGLRIDDSGKSYSGLFAYVYDAEIVDLSLLDVDITGFQRVGALAARIENSFVSNCYSSGAVVSRGTVNVGGLLGSAETGFMEINESRSSADVSVIHIADRFNAGGLVGYLTDNAKITNSYATGNIDAGSSVGGLVGLSSDGGTIKNSYATGNVHGEGDEIGGLVGTNVTRAVVNNSYSTGMVEGRSDIGGLVGSNQGTVEESFWDTETSGTTESEGGTGLATADMQTRSTFTDAGWDFTETWAMTSAINDGYPYLIFSEDYYDVGSSQADDEWADLPSEITLDQNYPNPFNPTTQIQYSIPSDTRVKLDVHTLTGRRIAVLVDEHQSAGHYEVHFDASQLSSGMYIYRLQTPKQTLTRQMMFVK